ncbi:hypothetical protein N7528_001387 [Penicillium herquei]|nr:hypothetical protein N7528_001387 [Penicillium herquei]
MKRFREGVEDATPKRQKDSHENTLSGRNVDHYTIAWFCAIHEELAAAKEMLDEIHECPPNIPKDDPNHYTLGSIKGHGVVITCLPEGGYGTCNASLVAANMKRSFPEIRVNLIVGIGGAVPGKMDIRLGDIVVGTRVMQYDLGKTVGGGKSERTAIPRTYDHLIGTTLTSLRSKHDRNPTRVPSILQQQLGKDPHLFLPNTPDRLFENTYAHPSNGSSCDECDRSKLVKRADRIPQHTLTIHYGAIGSGNQVVKHAVARDNLAQELDVICFEMEAAGLMGYLPCLPIRGICDYSDSHKTKEWQRCAALNAAAYAREFIEELRVTGEQVIIVSNPETDHSAVEERRKQMLELLRFDQIDSRRLTIKKHHTKTCQWFLTHPDYTQWLDPAGLKESNGFIWMNGKPGAGKSTIMKFAYLEMKRGTRKAQGVTLTASFFFNARGDNLERSTVGMYRSLLLQLLEGYPDLQGVLDDPEVVPPCQNECPSLMALKELFWNAVCALGNRGFTCFVDALDECDEQQVRDMVDYFEDLTEQSTDQDIPFKICVSSRHYPYITPRYGKRLILEDQLGHSKDLETYIKSRLRLRDTILMDELQLTLLAKAAGVFMWVVLVVDILNKEYQRGGLALRKRIAEIPSDLSELFKDILRRDSDNMEQLLLCIRWILFAQRPLRPVEFHLAVWSGLSLRNLVDNEIPAVSSPESERLKAFVIGSSKGLAEITKSKAPTVQFIHESVRNFLIKDHGLYQLWPELEPEWQSSGHEDLKQCCYMYLNHPSVLEISHNVMLESKSELRSKQRAGFLDDYPFLEYASQHVLDHSDAAAETISQEDFLSHFPLLHWIKMNNLFEKFKTREYSEDGNLFYILADKGCSNLIRTRMKHDPQVHSYVRNERYEYPLFAALASCKKNTVVAILNVPSSVADGIEFTDGLDLKYRKDFAAFKGHTPLTWAARHGRLGILKLLLEAGLDVNQTDRKGTSALSRALDNRHEAVARLLFQNGANIDTCTSNGTTALTRASRDGHEASVRLLIENGAMTSGGDSGGPALLQALECRHEAIAALLVENGANFHARDIHNMTPLSRALDNGYEEIARFLIENGADLYYNFFARVTPLTRASGNGYDAMVRLLIDKGVMGNGDDGGLALLTALANGHQAIATILIENGANVNTSDLSGMSPIFHASKMGYEALAGLLIDSGADVNAMNEYGHTPILLASQYGQDAIVRLLIDHGADVNSMDTWKNTPLSIASQYGHDTVVKLLIESKADVNAINQSGYTPLSLASQYGQGIVERLLIENGAVVKTIDPLDELHLHELCDETSFDDIFFFQ